MAASSGVYVVSELWTVVWVIKREGEKFQIASCHPLSCNPLETFYSPVYKNVIEIELTSISFRKAESAIFDTEGQGGR